MALLEVKIARFEQVVYLTYDFNKIELAFTAL